MTYTPVLPIPDTSGIRIRQSPRRFPRPRSPEEAVISIAQWTQPLTFLLEHWIGEPVVMRVAQRHHHEVTAAEAAVLLVPEGTPAWYRLGSMVPESWGTKPGVLPVALTGLLLLPSRLPGEVISCLDGGEPLGRVLARAGQESGLPASRVHQRESVTPATGHAAATAEVSALMYLGAALVALTWEKIMPWVWGGTVPPVTYEDIPGPSEFRGFPQVP
jgi:hypothetical protein